MVREILFGHLVKVNHEFTVFDSADFLEQEAPRMKDFLHTISSRSADGVGSIQETSILDWSGYIDQGKQLSILHSLLTENMSKLPTNRNSEMLDLEQILQRISNAKEMLAYPVGDSDMDSSLGKHQMQQQQHNQENQLPQQQVYVSGGHKQNDRGVIRGVLTPSSLEKNIFRYNDPTCAPLIQSLNAKNSQSVGGSAATNLDGMAALHHSHSTSSISSAPNYYYNDARNHMNSTPAKMSARKHMQNQYPIANSMEAIHKVPVSKAVSSGGGAYGQNPEIKHISHHVYDGLLNGSHQNHEGPAYRSHNTLPKNPQQHHNGMVSEEGGDLPLCSFPLTSSLRLPLLLQIAKLNGERGGNLIQIGLDPANAFVRKSPTPLLKTTTTHSSATSLQKNRPLNDSQLSLHSDRSTTNNSNKFNLSIGIPHNDHNQNYRANNYLQQSNSNNGVSAFRMPMNLEDLDDLLKYADEHQGETTTTKKQDIENGNVQIESTILVAPVTGGVAGAKESLTAKGSNNSIGQLSNMCSSGYQSISTTQSQSSSPVETGAGARAVMDYMNSHQQQQSNSHNRHAHQRTNNVNARNGPLKYQFGGTKATLNAVLAGKGSNHHHGHSSSQKSSSLTPSSSEERLSEDHYGHLNRTGTKNHSLTSTSGVTIGEIRGESELNMIASSLGGRSSSGEGRRGGGYNRTPRTNPLYYNNGTLERMGSGGSGSKGEDLSVSLPYTQVETGRHLNGARYQRRMSLESARTLSDSSSDAEGGDDSGKRRRNSTRSVEQYEKEIQRLQSSMDCMRRKLEDFELRDSNNDLASTTSSTHSDTKMRSIISR